MCYTLYSSAYNFLSTAPSIGFDPESYTYDEDAGEAVLTITTSDPSEFTDATGALFYTDDGTAVGSGGMNIVHTQTRVHVGT